MQAAGAAGQDFDVVGGTNGPAVAQLGFALADFLLLAVADLRGNIGPGHAQRARFAAAAFAFEHLVAHQGAHGLHRIALLHGVVARLVVQVAALARRQGDAFF